MENVTLKINGQDITVPANYTVLQAARKAGISIPTLCYLKDVSQTGSCRMCVVEVKGARNLQAACVYPVAEGLEVFTNTPKVRRSRKVTLELLLSNHDRKCLTCARNQNCELQTLSEEIQVCAFNAVDFLHVAFDFRGAVGAVKAFEFVSEFHGVILR